MSAIAIGPALDVLAGSESSTAPFAKSNIRTTGTSVALSS